jgi:hypothetical protein
MRQLTGHSRKQAAHYDSAIYARDAMELTCCRKCLKMRQMTTEVTAVEQEAEIRLNSRKLMFHAKAF